jgi:hypothetical protein
MQITKKEIIFFSFCGIFLLSIYIYNKYEYRNIDKQARYVIGVVTEKIIGKSGAYYKCAFSLNGKNFTAKFSGLALGYKLEDLVLIKVQETNPEINIVLYNYLLPRNLRPTDLPFNGWKSIPDSIPIKDF